MTSLAARHMPPHAGFSSRLKSTLTVTAGTSRHTLSGGAIKRIELDLCSYGFTGAVEFAVLDDTAAGGTRTDEVLASILKADMAKVTLKVEGVHWSPQTDADVTLADIEGVVTTKSMSESLLRHSTDMPILLRRYRLEFADVAQVLWRQHFPTELYTNKSVKDVITAHSVGDISVTCDWSSEFDAAKPMFFVHLPEAVGASFYDFVLWYVDRLGGFFWYDYGKKSYQIADAKPTLVTSEELYGDDMARATMHFAEVPRYQRVVCNSYSENATSTSIDQEQAESGIRRDTVMRSAIAQDTEDRVSWESARTPIPDYAVDITFARIPRVAITPGSALAVQSANRWSSDSVLVGKTWRATRMHLFADDGQGSAEAEVDLDSHGYQVELRLACEQKDDPQRGLPPVRVPRYPGYAEGKIVSEQGEDSDKTYQTYNNQTTSLDEYTVEVPLWSKQQITAPFEPHFGVGSVYIPAYRDERVLLALDLTAAHIARFLDWRADAVLSMDVQGEHILLGKSTTSQTSINHVYDGENPTFNVARTHDSDTSLIRLEEGALFMQVKEDSGS